MMWRSELLADGGIEEMSALVGIVPLFVVCCCWGRRRLGSLPTAQISLFPKQQIERFVCVRQDYSTGLGTARQSQQRSGGEEGHELPFEQIGWKGLGAELHVCCLRCSGYVLLCPSKMKMESDPVFQSMEMENCSIRATESYVATS